eukprot:2267749-Pyramimonas_sp.AAC.2
MKDEVAHITKMKATVEEKFGVLEEKLTQEVLRSSKLAGQVKAGSLLHAKSTTWMACHLALAIK